MEYLYPKYLESVEIESLEFTPLNNLSQIQLTELAKLYTTTFNSDNIEVIKELGIKGKTLPEGLWNEEPYTLEKAFEAVTEFLNPEYHSIVALGKTKETSEIIGLFVIQKKDKVHFESRNYKTPFEVPENVEYWNEVDILRREVALDKNRLKNLSGKMRQEILKSIHTHNPILLYSSTNSPIMVKAWEKNDFTVIERETIFGNKFQAFKLIFYPRS
jgi:hypothetical protein